MEISRHPLYAVFQSEELDSKPRFQILSNFSSILEQWRPSTRVSIVFGLEEFSTAEAADFSFAGENFIILLGPIHPLRLYEIAPPDSHVWLTLGVLNAVVRVSTKNTQDNIEEWARHEGVSYEAWRVVNGIVNSVMPYHPNSTSAVWRKTLAEINTLTTKPELRDACEEFMPLMASTVSRAEQYMPNLSQQLSLVISSIKTGLVYCNDNQSSPSYEFAGILTSINAALSRFSSQSFSGTSPIKETECHFWSHSLFGIGSATIGLWKFTNFIQETLGQERIPERFVELKKRSPNVESLFNIREHNEFWHCDHLREMPIPREIDPILPLIPYFSGRDGFKSTFNTISAPLAIISSCNCINWPVLTLTHEISHTIIKSIISEIYPDFSDSNDIEYCLTLLRKEVDAPNLFEQIRQLLFFAIAGMNYVETDDAEVPDNHEEFKELLDNWHHEVEEIMVSTFDFLYFYGRKSEQYIQGIWSSWSVIPNIYNRVHEYVIRSICAVMSVHLRRTNEGGTYDCEEYARDQILIHLNGLKEKGYTSPYIEEAIRYMCNDWDIIKERILPRKEIVKLVKAFLYSETIESKLKSESRLSSGAKHSDGYSFRPRHIESTIIDNPLRFLEYYTKGMTPSKADSAWIFYTLAFNVGEDETLSVTP